MKQICTLILALISLTMSAQAPQGFNYQAVVRDSNGQLLINQNVYFRFNIMQNSPTSLPVYTETHYAPTDDLGSVSLVIGQGTPSTGVFSEINWAEGTYYLGIELNTGNGYVAMGTTQFLSVPYALYANSAGFVNLSVSATGDTLWIGNQWVIIPGISEANNGGGGSAFTVVDIDGNEYHTVMIGNYEWMASNLKVTHYRNGESIAYPGENNDNWYNNTSGAYAWYNNNIEWKNIYGGLYNFYAVVNPNGLCPEGWTVPSTEHWNYLQEYIGGLESPNGNELKSCRQIDAPVGECHVSNHPRWDYSEHHGTNDYGFSAFPAGMRGVEGEYSNMGQQGHFWTSSEIGSGRAWARILYFDGGSLYVDDGYMKQGISVRCVKTSK